LLISATYSQTKFEFSKTIPIQILEKTHQNVPLSKPSSDFLIYFNNVCLPGLYWIKNPFFVTKKRKKKKSFKWKSEEQIRKTGNFLIEKKSQKRVYKMVQLKKTNH
jgi:hypothetical protein